MKSCKFLILGAVSAAAVGTSHAGKVRADFNDLLVNKGMRQVDGQPAGTGRGFAEPYWTENTAEVRTVAGSVAIPVTVAGFASTQGLDVNGGTGVVVGNNVGTRTRNGQERALTPLTGTTVWFAALVSLAGPGSEMHVVFNVNGNSGGGATGGFGVILGANARPGCLGIIRNSAAFVSAATTPDSADFLLVPNGAAVATQVVSTTVGAGNVLLGRIDVNPATGGLDTLSVWLNPADAQNPGTPTLVDATRDIVGAAGVFSVSIETVREATPTPAGGPFTAGGAARIDDLRISDDADALGYVTGQITIDPDLLQDPASPNPNFAFGEVGDDPAASVLPLTRTVTYTNFGVTQPITINSIALDDDSLFSVTPDLALPATLDPNESINVEVSFDTAPATGVYTTNLRIDTADDLLSPKQDIVAPVSATYVAKGSKLLTNGTFEHADFNYAWSETGSAFGPLAPGSTTAVRTVTGANLAQALVPATGDDFEVSFYFAVEQMAAPANDNRNFNVRLTRGGNTTSIINLGYFPAGGSLSGLPGFYVFNSLPAPGGWQPVIFDNGDPLTGNRVTLQNSLDQNADGDYDDAGDAKHVYFMRIVAADWGLNGVATYDLVLYDAAGNKLGESLALTVYQNVNLNTATPNSITFATDFGNNPGFIVDDVCAVSSKDNLGFPQATSPDLQVAVEPDFGLTLDPTGPLTRSMVLRNSGAAGSSLTISGITFSDNTHFSLLSALPGALAAGQSAAVDVQFAPGVDRGVFPCTISIASNDSLVGTETVAISPAAWNSGDVVNANCDFEATPFDAGWSNSGATQAAGMAGAKAAYIPAGGARIAQSVVVGGDWEFECLFAVRDSLPANRTFTWILTTLPTGATGAATVAVRYGEGYPGFSVFGNGAWQPAPALGTLLPSVDGDADNSLGNPGGGDVANIYKLKLVGRNWGDGAGLASYDILLSEANGASYTRALTDLRLIQNGNLDLEVPNGFRFDTVSGNNPGFWVDNACFRAGAPAADDPNLIVTTAPAWVQLLNAGPTSSDLVIDNNGAAGLLSISAITFTGANAANFSVAPGTTFPVQVGAGTQAAIPIVFTKGASPGGNFAATLKIASNDTTDAALGLTRDLALAVSAYDYGDQLLANRNFEADPFSTGWTIAGSVVKGGGLNAAAASTQCANLSLTAARLYQATPFTQSDLTMEFYFALSTIGSRTLNFRLCSDTAGAIQLVTFKYEAGALQGFTTVWQPLISGAGLSPSFDFDGSGVLGDHPSDIRNVYRLRLTARRFGTVDAKYDIALLNENGTLIGQATGQTIWAGPVTTTPVRSLEFNTNNAGAPFWVDDLSFTYDDPAAVDDYGQWAAGFPGFTDTAPGSDPDGDGLDNSTEYAFGLDPMSGASAAPIRVPFNHAAGTFTYTRRNTGLSGLAYSYRYSTTLTGAWTPFTPALETSDSASPVETVTITVPAALLANPRLFVQVVAQ